LRFGVFVLCPAEAGRTCYNKHALAAYLTNHEVEPGLQHIELPELHAASSVVEEFEQSCVSK
jgi:hypothetical protein